MYYIKAEHDMAHFIQNMTNFVYLAKKEVITSSLGTNFQVEMWKLGIKFSNMFPYYIQYQVFNDYDIFIFLLLLEILD